MPYHEFVLAQLDFLPSAALPALARKPLFDFDASADLSATDASSLALTAMARPARRQP
ncbi:MAG: hypothetical protein AB7N61_12530 [Acidimicrobiia bacterium]